MKKLILAFCLFSSTAFCQVQPQFKFYLAFEDASGARDTIWVIVDSAANEQITDTAFGELARPKSFTNFQVFLWSTASGDSIYNTWADNYGNQNSYFEFPSIPGIRMVNGVYPITIRWDTNQAINHELPFVLNKTWLFNDYIQNPPLNLAHPPMISYPNDNFIHLSDSLILFNAPNHFPISLSFSKNWPTGLTDNKTKSDSDIYFQRVGSDLYLIQENSSKADSYAVFNLNGSTLMTCQIDKGKNKIDIEQYSSGIYFIQFTSNNQYHVYKFFKL